MGRIWDSRAQHAGSTDLPATPTELGRVLRTLHGRTSLRQLEASQPGGPEKLVLSKSTLARFESGDVVPALAYADHLDDLYGGGGWIGMSVRALWRSSWEPWSPTVTSPPRRAHVGSWPATYRGPVWICVRPAAKNRGIYHHLTLDWGPWTCTVESVFDDEGVTLRTGKAADPDGVPVSLHLLSDHPVFTLYGAGESEGEDVLDIRSWWRKR